MKRCVMILLALVLCVSLCLSAFAEGTDKQFDPGNMSFPEGMTPPEGMNFPEGMSFPEGMTPPDGMSFPEGMTPPDGMGQPPQGFDGSSFPGGFPGGSQSQAEG